MRKFLQFFLRNPVLWLSDRVSSEPDKARIYNALTKLFNDILTEPGKKGRSIPLADGNGKFIIFSDQHKGRRNGADDFINAEPNYLAALDYYYKNDFFFINLGDCEELWENNIFQIKRKNRKVFEAEKKFIDKNAYIKVFGNHDLYWAGDPLAALELEALYGAKLKIYEGVILSTEIDGKKLQIFCTHGHQGDKRSDGNRLSKFVVALIWAPLQAYLRINPNEPSNNEYKKTVHNEIMYEWSASQQQTVVITGHTHQPVFESLTHIERLHRNFITAKKSKDVDTLQKINSETQAYRSRFEDMNPIDYTTIKPSYFNTGCCCFADGDITGIEIENGFIRLIKWEIVNGKSTRIVLEQNQLKELLQ
jgi:predicted phosphodiesterase